MKMSRELKRAINQRAYFVARALPNVFVARMTAAVEAGEVDAEGVEAWWPAEFDTARDRSWQVMAPVAGNAADVCANCDTALPEGCGGQFRGEVSCERRKRALEPADLLDAF